MVTPGVFAINILIYSFFPLLIGVSHKHARIGALYIYLGAVLLWGGLAGAVYSLNLSDSIAISGGNIAYGAFMMTAILLIIIERRTTTFWNLIRLLIGVDLMVFFGFNYLLWILKNGLATNPFGIPYEVFHVSFWVLISGGILIFIELLILLHVFIFLMKKIKKIFLLSLCFLVAYVFVLCLDGLLFPIAAFGIQKELVPIIFGNITGKFILAISFGLPFFLLLMVNKEELEQFVGIDIHLKDLLSLKREHLINKIYEYEKREIQSRKQIDQLKDISGKDQLTGIANRRKFELVLENEWRRSKRKKTYITLAIGDIDFFKQYNDCYGHYEGDLCLKRVSALWLQAARRSSDLAARIGGEEFALIFPEVTSGEALKILESFQANLSQEKIEHKNSSGVPFVTMSIGIASCIPDRDASPVDIFKLADQRLYRAKESGRNTIVHADTY